MKLPDLTNNQIDTIISKTEYRVSSFIPQTITMDDILSSGNKGTLNAEVKKKLFELRALQQQLENSQNVTNEDVVWHIKQYESASDYSYPKFKKIHNTKSPRLNPELLKKVLWTNYGLDIKTKNINQLINNY